RRAVEAGENQARPHRSGKHPIRAGSDERPAPPGRASARQVRRRAGVGSDGIAAARRALKGCSTVNTGWQIAAVCGGIGYQLCGRRGRSRKGQVIMSGRKVLAKIKGFTLVELLVVIGIIALLISILMPALTKARSLALTAKSGANLHNMGIAMTMYTQQYGYYPGHANFASKIYAVWPT